MRYVVTLMILFFVSTSSIALADDAETNPLAKKIKTKLQRKVSNKFDDYQGYCDVMIEMEHKSKKAAIKRVTSNGDKKVCRYVKSNLKVGKRYRYNFPEKYIRLHISSN
ncbi:hypothetical protein ATG66_2490 [Vibrio sp. ES.051]|uniref:hypothetical protein n=1 Tax=Vibrio sp. ES.051 TaxID=1761909 RepID=UPI000BF2FCEE|nr:hypothetical protein [Vibrio sp. ES.051]PFG56164.1 hypothetical protein ATG66_2490 [Vibrio sp. ES.051]